MTPTRAIKLLKNGEAQLYYDNGDTARLDEITVAFSGCKFSTAVGTFGWAYIYQTKELGLIWGTVPILDYPIIKLSDIEERPISNLFGIEITEFNKDMPLSEFFDMMKKSDKIMQSLKPNTMQVTNNNGEITLNGIKIDNETADRIVEIRKEQLSKENELPAEFERDVHYVINCYANKGLKKADLVSKMEYMTKSCVVS